jgi:hypothetical protein
MKPVEVQTYARALERIYEVNLTPAVLGGRPMHPHLYDRLLAAGVQPSYPRPAPPRRDAYAAVVVAPLGVFGLAMAVVAATPEGRKLDEPALLRKMALTGGDATQVGDLALLRWKAGDAAAAATLYRAELALGDDGVYPRSDLAIVLAGEGLCDEARNAVAPLDGGQLRGKASKRHVDAGGAVAQCYVRRAFRPRDDASGMEWSSGCGTS